MAETHSHSSPHLNRIHHHRARVAAAHAAIGEQALADTVAHYARIRSAAPESATSDPPAHGGPEGPSTVQ